MWASGAGSVAESGHTVLQCRRRRKQQGRWRLLSRTYQAPKACSGCSPAGWQDGMRWNLGKESDRWLTQSTKQWELHLNSESSRDPPAHNPAVVWGGDGLQQGLSYGRFALQQPPEQACVCSLPMGKSCSAAHEEHTALSNMRSVIWENGLFWGGEHSPPRYVANLLLLQFHCILPVHNLAIHHSFWWLSRHEIRQHTIMVAEDTCYKVQCEFTITKNIWSLNWPHTNCF